MAGPLGWDVRRVAIVGVVGGARCLGPACVADQLGTVWRARSGGVTNEWGGRELSRTAVCFRSRLLGK